MKVLLTGANGYIGTRLLPLLIKKGDQVVALVRNPMRLEIPKEGCEIFIADLMKPETLRNLPKDIDAAYYLVHSMSDDPKTFSETDAKSATNFRDAIKNTNCKQIIYLSGLVKDKELSLHFKSRLQVEEILRFGPIPVTTLRASIIIGSGSASFEIIRDLVEKLPFMVTPKWVNKKAQPIAIADVLDYLTLVLNHSDCLDKIFEIAGPEKISYKEMLNRYAKARDLKRLIITVPLLTPKLSSYWLIFVTSTNFYLASSLINSLKNDSIKTDFSIDKIFPKKCLTYEESIQRALQKIAQNAVVSSFRDSWTFSGRAFDYSEYIEPPKHGCLSQTNITRFFGDPDKVMTQVFLLGGKNGYYLNWAWKLRGSIDEAFGGVGYRRGKTEKPHPRPGDIIDFWRVILSDKEKRRFILYAEMQLPGEAWLELKIEPVNDHFKLIQTATFRPKGILGRLYWYALYPMHIIIFGGLGKKLIKSGQGKLL